MYQWQSIVQFYVVQYLLYNNQMKKVTYSYTRQHLNTILGQKNHYDSLVETAYLLRKTLKNYLRL